MGGGILLLLQKGIMSSPGEEVPMDSLGMESALTGKDQSHGRTSCRTCLFPGGFPYGETEVKGSLG